jgi:TonB family protein
MTRFSFTVCLLTTFSVLSCRSTCASNPSPPVPAKDFPSLDSYYPPAAARAGQEGTAIIHVCVDTNGKLTEPPLLAGSSGNAELDAAAINLANAGNGHYLPGVENGVPVQGCGGFKIAFKLRGSAGLPINDPRLPTIGARIRKLNDEMARRMEARVKELGKPLPVVQAALDSPDPAAERAIRQYARTCDSFIDEMVAMAADFFDDIDYLQESPDIPEAEWQAFQQQWPNSRSALVVEFRETIGTIRDLMRVADELGDYVAFSAPRRSAKDTDQAHLPPDDPQLIAIKEHTRTAVEKLQNVMRARGVFPPKDSQ